MKKSESSYHHGNLRHALIAAGVEILKRGDVQKLSLREVARIAGVSQAAPYRHFENKDALLAAIAQEGFTVLGDRIRAVNLADHPDAEEQLFQVALAYLKLALERTDHFRLMFCSLPSLQATKFPEFELATQQLFKELLSVVEHGQRQGTFRTGDSRQLTLFAWSSFHGLTDLLISRHLEFLPVQGEKSESCLRNLIRTLFIGLRPS